MAIPKESGFRFERIWLRELRFEDTGTRPPKGKVELDLGFEVNIEVAEDNSEAAVTVKLTMEPKGEDGFKVLTVALQGLFVATTPEARAKLADFAFKQGAALLVPFVRELVANVTARARTGAAVLPPLNLYELDVKTAIQARR